MLLAKSPNAQAATKPRIETEGDEATVYIYDVIDSYWGINAQDFAKEIAALSASTINVRINSPGGDVFDAVAIKTALAQHKAKVVVHIDGLAASAASVIMLAGDEIRIVEGAFVMIHNAWSWAIGNAADMRKTADLLEKVDSQIATQYAKKTGAKLEQVQTWMAQETWFTADEAVENGFVDSKVDAEVVENSFDLSAFEKTPKALTERAPKPKDDAEGAKMRATAERRLAFYERTAA